MRLCLRIFFWHTIGKIIRMVLNLSKPTVMNSGLSGDWLFQSGDISSFHKVQNNEELWLIHFRQLLIHVLEPGGATVSCALGWILGQENNP